MGEWKQKKKLHRVVWIFKLLLDWKTKFYFYVSQAIRGVFVLSYVADYIGSICEITWFFSSFVGKKCTCARFVIRNAIYFDTEVLCLDLTCFSQLERNALMGNRYIRKAKNKWGDLPNKVFFCVRKSNISFLYMFFFLQKVSVFGGKIDENILCSILAGKLTDLGVRP